VGPNRTKQLIASRGKNQQTEETRRIEENIANCSSDKGLAFRICKPLKQLSSKKLNNLI
jgi:hypothetical protein